MGAASADIPAIVVTGGPMLNGHWRGREVGACTDCWHYHEELRAGRITEADCAEIEDAMSRSNGHCMTMGTASTMACVTEALGLTLPGGAAIPAVDARRVTVAESAGRRSLSSSSGTDAVGHPHPRGVENAIRVLHAISRLDERDHPPARVRRPGRVELPLQLLRRALRLDALARRPEAGRRAT